jgi:hypothetical protein
VLAFRGRGCAAVYLAVCWNVAVLLGSVGCGSPKEESAHAAADRFVAAVGSSDARQACDLLAPRTLEQLELTRHEGCEQALPSLGLPSDVVTEVQAWGDAAQARTAGDVLFLRELDAGWRVVAAGCRPPQDQNSPYECELEGS